jgi:DNA-binding NarL/FixJ family response regulator
LQSSSGKKYIVNLTPSQTVNKFAATIYAYIIPQVETDLKKDSLFAIGSKNLTQRQMEIIELVIQGKTNEEIADELFISVNTVKTHLNNIYRELNVSNRFSLYSRLIEN